MTAGRAGSLRQPRRRESMQLNARARKALKRHPRARLVLRTTLRLPSGRAIHATKTLSRRRR
jgi:hypothetical protein